MKPWHEQTGAFYFYDQYALNEAATAFAKYDPDRIVAELLSLNADIYMIYATNQFNLAYYPSRVIPQHPGLRGRDYVGEIVPRLRREGKRVLLYTNWLDSKHPEWNTVPLQADGTAAPANPDYPLVSWADPAREEWRVRQVPGGKWQLPCFNSPKRELIFRIWEELARNYDFDGFHLDMFFHNQFCVCEYCKPHLQRLFGDDTITWQNLTRHWPEYIDWKLETCAGYIRELTARVKAIKPELVALHNMGWFEIAANIGVSERWLPAVDLYLSECSFSRDLLMSSLSAKHHRAVRKPSWMLVTSTPHVYLMGHSPISKAKAMIFAAGAKANGTGVFGFCGVGARQDTTSDRRLLQIVRETLAWWKGVPAAPNPMELTSAASVAVLFSWATNAFRPPRLPQDLTLPTAGEMRGWAQRLIEEHIPFNLEIAENAADGRLDRYDLIILPDLACTTPALEEALRRFVRRGGTLLVTGDTSLYDEQGRQKADFGLADLLGVSFAARYPSTKFYQEDPFEPIICNGNALCVKATSATVQARLVTADPAGAPDGGNDPLPQEVTDWPLLVQNRCGKGQVFYLAWNPGEFYNTADYWQTAAEMSRMLETVLPERPFRTDAPATVEIMNWQPLPRRLVLCFVNRTTPNLNANELVPINGLTVEFPASRGKIIRADSAETPVTVKHGKARTTIQLKRLDAYAAVTLEFASTTGGK